MNILLTGTTGFLGSTIAHLLLKNNATVFGIVRENSDTSRISDILNHPRFHVVRPDDVAGVFNEHFMDVVVHTAASFGRQGESVEQVEEANIHFPMNLLKLAIEKKSKGFINSDTFLDPNPADTRNYNYVRTKKEFLRLSKEAAAQSSIKYVNMRIEQMYGPNDNPTKFIPFWIKQFLSGKDRIPLTPGMQERDYVYVDDVAEAYVKVVNSIDTLEQFEEFGLGSGKTNTLQELAHELKTATKSPSVSGFGDTPYSSHEVMHSVADITNNTKISWVAKTSLTDGVKKTVEFYKNAQPGK